MFIGHFAVGFASKRVAPRASLGVLMAAPLALDLLWPFFLLAGKEVVRIDPGNTAFTPFDFVSYPYTHSLAAALVWSAVFGGLYWAWRRDSRAAWIIAAGVVSHWVLDFITHRPDLPLWPGSERVGLGLWNSVAGTLITELAMFGTGVWLYASGTRARDRVGTIGLWSFVVFVLLIYAANQLGPPPPDVRTLAWAGLLQWLFPLWAWWFDWHRSSQRSRAR